MSWELEIVQGPHAGARISLAGGEVTLGRDQQASYVLPGDPGIARVHTRVFIRDGICHVVDMSGGAGTYLNGSPVSAAPMQMRGGDVIAISATVIRLVDLTAHAAPQPGAPTQAMPPQGMPQQPPAPGYPPQQTQAYAPQQQYPHGQHPPQQQWQQPQQPYGQPQQPYGQPQHPYAHPPQYHNSPQQNVNQQVTVVQQSSNTGWWIALVIVLLLFLGPCGLMCLGVAIFAVLPYCFLLGGLAMGIIGMVNWNKYRDNPGWESQASRGLTMMIVGYSLAGIGLLWILFMVLGAAAA